MRTSLKALAVGDMRWLWQHVVMPSWRDSASQQAQDDLDGLLNAALPFAQEMLSKRGEFFPYGAAISSDGETRLVGGDPGQGEKPLGDDLLAALVQAFRAGREGLRAVAVAVDVRIADSDAVRVEVEHREGQALVMLLRYKKKRFPRGIEYGNLSASPGERQIWV